MIKWKLYSGDTELIERVTDVVTFPDKDWLEMLEEDKTNLFGLLAQRKLNVHWSLEPAKNLQVKFGTDLEKRLTEELAEEIRREMDNELIKALLGGNK